MRESGCGVGCTTASGSVPGPWAAHLCLCAPGDPCSLTASTVHGKILGSGRARYQTALAEEDGVQPEVLEGTWEEVSRHGAELAGKRVRVTVLPGQVSQPGKGTMISRGMFPQLRELTEDDFKGAEFAGDADDGLDWK